MRLIALFFSFYILFLTALPCADVPVKDHSHDVSTSQHSTNHEDDDQCSPFCTCNCCSTAIICQIHAVDFQITSLVREHRTTYPTLFVTQRSGDIWQPPQLS
ncbi:MAG TPA: DUF6660 family protein [Bacteroidales bacterium]|nr:DUF6660 family protein [Bacteroidales bacterium]